MGSGDGPAPGLDVLDHAAADGTPIPVPVTVPTGFLGAIRKANRSGVCCRGRLPVLRLVTLAGAAHVAADRVHLADEGSGAEAGQDEVQKHLCGND